MLKFFVESFFSILIFVALAKLMSGGCGVG
jgi:hypothetical protein